MFVLITSQEERKIIFVANSLGGLVTQACLWKSRNNPEPHLQRVGSCIVGLLFLGTPNHGADLAAWAEFGAKFINEKIKTTNSDILRVLERRSEMLFEVQEGFHNLLRLSNELDITCFYEELPLHVVGKVHVVYRRSNISQWITYYW